MKTHASSSLTLAQTFEQFLEDSSFARRTRESYTEDLAPLLMEGGQQPATALTADVIQAFLTRQEALASATYNRRLAALRSFIRWLHDQGWVAETLLDGMKRKPEGKRAARALDAQKVESVLRKIEDPRDRTMVAHVVKTEKSAKLRATLLLFRCYSYCLFQLSPCENTLQPGSGSQAPGRGARDYKTRNSGSIPGAPRAARDSRAGELLRI